MLPCAPFAYGGDALCRDPIHASESSMTLPACPNRNHVVSGKRRFVGCLASRDQFRASPKRVLVAPELTAMLDAIGRVFLCAGPTQIVAPVVRRIAVTVRNLPALPWARAVERFADKNVNANLLSGAIAGVKKNCRVAVSVNNIGKSVTHSAEWVRAVARRYPLHLSKIGNGVLGASLKSFPSLFHLARITQTISCDNQRGGECG